MKKLVESIIDLLLRKKIIIFSKIEDSFYLYKKLDKNINLTEEIIKLNYLKESPYGSEVTQITSILNQRNLYLWFNNRKNYRYLPEALLVYRKLSLKYQNIICLIRGDVDKVVIVKNSILVSSFSKKNIREHDILLMKNEYALEEVIMIEKGEYSSFLNKAYADLKFKDILNILNLQIDFKNLFFKLIKWLALPLLIISIIISLLLGAYNYYVEEERGKLFLESRKKQKSTLEMKENINNNEKENITFNNLANEFKYVDKTAAISTIIQISKDMNMTISYVKVYNNQVEFAIKTKNQFDIPLYIKGLFKSNNLTDIKNLSSRSLRDKRVEVRMSAKLKER